PRRGGAAGQAGAPVPAHAGPLQVQPLDCRQVGRAGQGGNAGVVDRLVLAQVQPTQPGQVWRGGQGSQGDRGQPVVPQVQLDQPREARRSRQAGGALVPSVDEVGVEVVIQDAQVEQAQARRGGPGQVGGAGRGHVPVVHEGQPAQPGEARAGDHVADGAVGQGGVAAAGPVVVADDVEVPVEGEAVGPAQQRAGPALGQGPAQAVLGHDPQLAERYAGGHGGGVAEEDDHVAGLDLGRLQEAAAEAWLAEEGADRLQPVGQADDRGVVGVGGEQVLGDQAQVVGAVVVGGEAGQLALGA